MYIAIGTKAELRPPPGFLKLLHVLHVHVHDQAMSQNTCPYMHVHVGHCKHVVTDHELALRFILYVVYK